MTIAESDRQRFRDTVADFLPQEVPDSCLPIALKNILDELSDRHDVSDLRFTKNELRDICDYTDGLGSSAEKVPPVLGAEIEEVGYTVKVQINCSFEDLTEILQKGTCSYPLVELDPDYFDLIENWNPQPGRRGYSFPHIIIPFKLNSQSILFYDPFEKMMVKSGQVSTPPQELSQTQFYELWSGRAHPRWTMWIEQLEQQTLTAAMSRGE